jgi:hypothetical protein
MPKTKVLAEIFFPTTALTRISDFTKDLDTLRKNHKGLELFVTISGPYPDNHTERGIYDSTADTSRPGGDGRTGSGERSERGQAAAADFGDGTEAEQPNTAAEPEAGDSGKPAGRKPRSDAGKPRGARGAEASGSAAEGPERAGRGAGSEGGAKRDGNGDAPQGGRKGRGEGQGQDGGPRERGRGAGRADGGDAEASRVAPQDEDWGSGGSSGASEDLSSLNDEEGEEWWAKTPDSDGWPDHLMPEGELDRGAMSTIFSDHYRSHGGKFRAVTFDLLWDATQDSVHGAAENLDQLHPDDFDHVARIMLRDAAKYRHGIKKPVTKAPTPAK